MIGVTTRPAATETAVDVDPRIAARRAEVAAERRRSRGRRLAILALGPLGLAALYGLTRTSALDVDEVTVTGAQFTAPAAIAETSGIAPGDQMTDLDLDAAKVAIEALPWIRTARVARTWPGTVRVAVVERAPVARIAAADGGWWLADETGRLIDVVADPWEGLTEVDGLVQGGVRGIQLSEDATAVVAMVPRFPDTVRSEAFRIGVSPNGTLEMWLRPSLAVADQERDQFEDALAAVLTARGAVGADGAVLAASPEVLGAAADAAEVGEVLAALVTAGPPAGPDLEDAVAAALGLPPPVVHFGPIERVDEKLLALEAVLDKVDVRCIDVIDVRIARSVAVTRRDPC